MILAREGPMGKLTRFMSDEKLQAEGLAIMTELIRRDLLRVNVSLANLLSVISCRAGEAYVTGSRDSAGAIDFRQPIKQRTFEAPKPRGPGITLTVRQQFRLPPADEEEVSKLLDEMTKKSE
jgi:hypothetical protein